MVRRWIIMIVLIFILTAGCIFEFKYVNNSFNWFINSLETLQIQLTQTKDKIDTEENIKYAYKIDEEWHDKVQNLKCLIWHSGIKEIEIGLARVAVYVKENDYKEASAEIAALIDYSAHYLDDFTISDENLL